LYQAQGKHTKAEVLLKKAIEINPENDVVYNDLGHKHKKQTNNKDAKWVINENEVTKKGELGAQSSS